MKELSRRDFLKVAGAIGAGIFVPGILSSCSKEKTSSTLPPTSVLPTTTEATTTTTEQIVSTTETTEKPGLVDIQEQTYFDLPTDLSNAINERVGDVDKITLLTLKQTKDAENLASLYFIDSGEKHFVAFSKDAKYKVYQYSINAELRGNTLESFVQYSLDNGEELIKFRLGGEFEKQTGDNTKAYLDRVGPLLAGAKESTDKMAEILKASAELNFSMPGFSISYLQDKNKKEIAAFVDGVGSSKNFIHDWDNPPVLTEAPDMDYAKELHREFEGLIIEDPNIKTLEDLKNLPANPKNYKVPTSYASQIPQDLQKEFQGKNPEYKIIYALNDDPSLRSVITNKPFWAKIQRDVSYLGETTGDNDYAEINGFIEGFIIVENKVILRLYDGGITNNKMHVVLDLNKNSNNPTGVGFNNLDTNSRENQPNEFTGNKFRLAFWLPDNHSAASIIHKDDFVKIYSFNKDNETGLRIALGIVPCGNNDQYQKFISEF